VDPRQLVFEKAKYYAHIEDKAVADLFEWDETIAYNEESQFAGRIGQEDERGVQLKTLPKPYWQYKELFEEKKAEILAPRRTLDHSINLKEGTEPQMGPIYPMSAHQPNKLDKYIKQILAQGNIVDSESSDRAPIVFVPKPDGSLPLCVDYWNLNKLKILNKYPLPLMDELRDWVAGAMVFTKLDIKDRSHLIRMRKGDEPKRAFRTRYGQYEYKIMPFGLVNIPETFPTMMNKILTEFLDHGVVVYLDDILVYSEKIEEHNKLVQQVLNRLEQHDQPVLLKNSVFHQEEVKFLAYIVKTSGVSMSDRKVKGLENWAHPRSIKEVQIIIGFANLYPQFRKDFSKVCKPITETLKGNPQNFHWGREQVEAFEQLNRRFTMAPIVFYFYPGRKTVVETDASDFVLEGVLSQYRGRRLHVVAFHSQKLNSAEEIMRCMTKKYSQ